MNESDWMIVDDLIRLEHALEENIRHARNISKTHKYYHRRYEASGRMKAYQSTLKHVRQIMASMPLPSPEPTTGSINWR